MIKIIIFFFVIFKIFFLTNENSNAQIQNKILANVENQIISSYELKNKIKTVLVLSKQEINQKKIDLVKNQAMRTLINYKLKKQQVLKFDISSKASSLERYLKNISLSFNTDINGLKKIFKNNNINFELYLDEIKTEIAWQNLIVSIYKNKITLLDEKEIENELRAQIKNKKDLTQYKLAEIEILLEDNVENKNNEKIINTIKDQIKKIGFKETAIKFSDSSSSLDGGNLGWINSKELSENILLVVKKMKIGGISEPINLTDRILVLQLLDKKNLKISDKNIESLRSKIINKKRNDILSLYSNSYLSKLKNNAFIKIK